MSGPSAVSPALVRRLPPEDREPPAPPPPPPTIQVAYGVSYNPATRKTTVTRSDSPAATPKPAARPAPASVEVAHGVHYNPATRKTTVTRSAPPSIGGLTSPHRKTVSEERVPLLKTHLANGRETLQKASAPSVGSQAWVAAMTEHQGARKALLQDRDELSRQVAAARRLRSAADMEDRRLLGAAITWGSRHIDRINATLASDRAQLAKLATRDPDLIRPGEKVPLRFDAPPIRVVTNEEVRWDLRGKADGHGSGRGEAARVASDPVHVDDPLRPVAKIDPVGYAGTRLALDHADDAQYQRVLQRVLPGVRGDYTQAWTDTKLAQGDLAGAIGLVGTNLDHTADRAERQALWGRVDSRFTTGSFGKRIDALRVPQLPTASSLSPNPRGMVVGEWITDSTGQGLPPEIATPMTAALKSRVLDGWKDSEGTVGPQLYAGLGRLSQAADVPHNDAAPVTPGLANWLVERVDRPDKILESSTPAEFDIAARVQDGEARLAVALARGLDDPARAHLRTQVVEQMHDGVEALREDTRTSYDTWTRERAAVDFVDRHFTDRSKPGASAAQERLYRSRNPDRADAIDAAFLALGEQGRKAAQVLQDTSAGGVFGTRERLGGADARLERVLDFGRGTAQTLQTAYQGGDQQKVAFAIQHSPQLRQAIGHELRFSGTEASVDSAARWGGNARRFIAGLAGATDRQTGAPMLTRAQAERLDAGVTRWQSATQAELAQAQPDDARLAAIDADLDRLLDGELGRDWIAGQLRAELPIKRHGSEELQAGAIQLRAMKNAVDLFGEAYLRSSIQGTLKAASATQLHAGGSFADVVGNSPLVSRYAQAPGWMPWAGVDGAAAAKAADIGQRNARLAQAAIDAHGPGATPKQRQAIVDDFRRRTLADIDKDLALHGQQTPFDDPSTRRFGGTMRAISVGTSAVNAYNQLVLRAGEDRANPSMLVYGAFNAATAARDSVALGGVIAGRDLNTSSKLFRAGSKGLGAAWLVPEVVYLGSEAVPNGTNVEKALQGLSVAGQAASSASLIGLEARIGLLGLTTGGVGTLVGVAAQLASTGYDQVQAVRDANLFETGTANGAAQALGLGFTGAQKRDKRAVQQALGDLGFSAAQSRELLNQTGHGVSPMLALEAWGEARGLSFERRLDYLRRLSPQELRETLVAPLHGLIDDHMDRRTLQIPKTSPSDVLDTTNALAYAGQRGYTGRTTRPVTSLLSLDQRLEEEGIGLKAVMQRPWNGRVAQPPAEPTKLPAAAPRAEVEWHTVERGDTLWDLYGGRAGLDHSGYPVLPRFAPALEDGDPFGP